jgi:hypothetical protein
MNGVGRYIGLLLIAGIGLLSAGCESTLDWSTDDFPKLTIISHLAPGSWQDQRVFVYVSKSPLDSTQFYTPAGLDVVVTEIESATTINLDSVQENGVAFFPFPNGFLQAGHSYFISASAPGFETVHATTRIPTPSTIKDLQIKNVRTEPSNHHEFKKIIRYNVEFKIDHFESNRYYHLIFYNEYTGDESNLYIVEPELSDDLPYIRHYDFGVLADREDFEPDQVLQFEFKDWVLNDDDIRKVYVELRTITAEYYKYHSSLARQLIVRQDPFAEPVPIYNNINGGYGNFSGFIPDIYSSDLPD